MTRKLCLSRFHSSYPTRGNGGELAYTLNRINRKMFFTLISLLLICHYPSSLVVAQTGTSTAASKADKTIADLAPVERKLNGGETHSYQITLQPKQFLHALIEQKGIDVSVGLFSPSGEQIGLADSPNDQWGNEPILLVADTGGAYRIDIRSGNSKAPSGNYEIKILSLRPATQTDTGHARGEKLFEEARKLRQQQIATSQREAVPKYKEALALFETAGDVYRQAITYLSIGITHARLNEFRVALDHFTQARALAQRAGDQKLEAATETFLGGMHDVLGNVKNALDHYNRALILAKDSQYRSAEANSLNNIGKIYGDVADWQKSQDHYRQALAIHRELGNQVSEGRALQNIGVSFLWLGEPAQALNYLQQALVINRSFNEKALTAEVLILIGGAHFDAGEIPKAFETYNQALVLTREIGNRGLEGNALDRLGVAYSSTGDSTKALDHFQRALEIRRATGDRRREAISLNNLGRVYNQLSEPTKGIKYYDDALTILRDIGDLNNMAIALEGAAKAEQLQGNLGAANKRIEESLKLIETVRARTGSQQLRTSYLASMEKAYDFHIDLLMQMHEKEPTVGYDAEALRASERGRARSLVELLNEAHVDIRQGVGAELIAKERQLNQQLNVKAQRQIQLRARKGSAEEIATLDREIGALEDEYLQVQVAIRKSSPQYAALTAPQPLDLKGIQKELDADTVLLEYSLGDDRSYVWVVTTDSLKTYPLAPRKEIEKSARHVYELLTTRSVSKPAESAEQRRTRVANADSQLQQAAKELSDMVVGPVAKEIGEKRLIIVADGALQYIPFSMLSVASDEPLIFKHEIVNLPSASALAVQRQTLAGRKLAPNAVAVIADPVFSANDERLKPSSRSADQHSEQVNAGANTRIIEHLADDSGKFRIRRLRFTRREADQILAVAPRTANLKAIDFKANRITATSSELGKYRYVHFATHGYLDSERPDLSAMILSLVDEKGKPQDGFLRAHEIYNLNLPAELVVLSACQTGLGKEIKGEGLVGLTRGFMYAGARRVVVSLWNVNDKATAELMQRFYRRMLKEQQSPALALRAAQVEMWQQKEWASPYYWAAFTLQGEWR